jgi:predicted dehydrogenase
MADIRVGIIGAGWPGLTHARAYNEAGGFSVVAVSDLIPDRRQKFIAEFGAQREYSDGLDLIKDPGIDAVSICVPNHLHAPFAIEALRSGKHVLCEPAPALSAAEARKMSAAAEKRGKILMYALQRRYSPHVQAASQAVSKSFLGDVYHARAAWTRTRGIPQGTGWFTQRDKSGGGAMCDVGLHMLDLAWHLLGSPRPLAVFAATHRRFADLVPNGTPYDVEDSGFALFRFENGKSLELAASWAINQPPHQDGTTCRLYGSKGAIEVFTPQGAVLYRDFSGKDPKQHPLKPPKIANHLALLRQFRHAIGGKASPQPNGPDGVTLMEMLEAFYQSAETGKSAKV